MKKKTELKIRKIIKEEYKKLIEAKVHGEYMGTAYTYRLKPLEKKLLDNMLKGNTDSFVLAKGTINFKTDDKGVNILRHSASGNILIKMKNKTGKINNSIGCNITSSQLAILDYIDKNKQKNALKLTSTQCKKM